MATTSTRQTVTDAPSNSRDDALQDDALDRLVDSLDTLLKVLTVPPVTQRASPATHLPADALTTDEQRVAGNLMRVNHAGEISAQGLYFGQALVARNADIRRQLLHAAEEETDHLAWCDERLRELGAQPSVLTPLWLLGSFAIGAVVGLSGDQISLGFVEETEHQVKAHLDSHDARLPENDHRSRAIIAQMSEDELRHADEARAAGGDDLPPFAPPMMRLVAKVMTTLAARA